MSETLWKKVVAYPILMIFLGGILCVMTNRPLSAVENSVQKKSVESSDEGDKNKKKDEKKEKEAAPVEEELVYEVSVVGKRIPEESFKADRSVEVLEKKAVQEQNPRTVPEALFEVPGTFVQRTNLGGGSPIVRGMIGPQLLIIVDGVRFNNSTYRTGPGQYLNLIDPLSIERIEVLRGPGSVLYGSDAMGGVIQVSPLITVDPRQLEGIEIGGNLLTRYSSANQGSTLHGHFDIGYKGFSFLGGGSYKKFNDLKGGRGGGTQVYSGYDHLSAVGKSTFRFSRGLLDNWSLTFGYLFTRIDDAGRADKLYNKNSLQIYDNKDSLIYGRLHMEFPSINSEGNLIISYHDFFEGKDTTKVEDDYKTPIKTTRDEVAAGTVGIDFQATTQLRENLLWLNYGAMWYHDSVNSDRFIQNAGEGWITSQEQSYPDNSSYENYGLYALLEWDTVRWKKDRFFRLGGGCRLHGMSAHAPGKDGHPVVDFSNIGHVFLFSAQYLDGSRANIAFTYSQGFRSPNLQEAAMVGDAGSYFHIANYHLGPERSDTFELLARRRFGNFTLSCTGYMSLLHNLIKREDTVYNGQSEIDGKDVVQSVNAGEGIIWGLESRFSLSIGHNFKTSGHFTYTFGEEKIDDGENIPLSRIPPLFGQVKVRYETNKYITWQGFIETYARFAAKQDRLSPRDIKDNRIPDGGTPGWWTWNIRAGVLLWDHFRLSLNLENILNKKYKYHGSGIYSAGTNVTLTLEIL